MTKSSILSAWQSSPSLPYNPHLLRHRVKLYTGLLARVRIGPGRGIYLGMSQKRTVLSSLAVAKRQPSAVKASALTSSVWPRNGPIFFAVRQVPYQHRGIG